MKAYCKQVSEVVRKKQEICKYVHFISPVCFNLLPGI